MYFTDNSQICQFCCRRFPPTRVRKHEHYCPRNGRKNGRVCHITIPAENTPTLDPIMQHLPEWKIETKWSPDLDYRIMFQYKEERMLINLTKQETMLTSVPPVKDEDSDSDCTMLCDQCDEYFHEVEIAEHFPVCLYAVTDISELAKYDF